MLPARNEVKRVWAANAVLASSGDDGAPCLGTIPNLMTQPATWSQGVCRMPCTKPGRSDCSRGPAGVVNGKVASRSACVRACLACERCRFVSYSQRAHECVWFHTCDLGQLDLLDGTASHHATAQIRGDHAARVNSSRWLGEARLRDAMLERGVLGARSDRRLACFHRTAAARPVTVAALGGSITAGLAYRMVVPGERSDFLKNLYHHFFARWLSARWPATQLHATSPNYTINLGVPATGPTLFALCLSSLLPSPPDLALLEFGINADEGDLAFFASLLRALRKARVPTIVVNVHRYGAFSGCGSSIHCLPAATFEAEAADSQAAALERLARAHSTPVVSLRRAVHEAVMLGQPPFVLAQFMNDCRHPRRLGHAFLAQLLAHAVEQAATGGECPPPRRQSTSTAAAERGERGGWPAGALRDCGGSCLRNDDLRAAAQSARGFVWVGGRKPGWHSTRAGSELRLRVRVAIADGGDANGGRGGGAAELQLGFVESWRDSFGAARVACEPPCDCQATESLEGHAPKSGRTITSLRAVSVRRAANESATECVLRVTTVRGALAAGEEFDVRALIVNRPFGKGSPSVQTKGLIHMEASLSHIDDAVG